MKRVCLVSLKDLLPLPSPRTVAGEALIRQAEEAQQRAPELGAQ